MSADRNEEGLEFTGFNLAEESAGEWENVSASQYRPVAAVVKLDSFEIDFEPDEEDAEVGLSSRRRKPPAKETTSPESANASTRSVPPEQGPKPEAAFRSGGAATAASSTHTEEASVSNDNAPLEGDFLRQESPLLEVETTADLPGSPGSPAPTGAGKKSAVMTAEEAGVEGAGDFGGLLGDLASSGTSAQAPLFPAGTGEESADEELSDFFDDADIAALSEEEDGAEAGDAAPEKPAGMAELFDGLPKAPDFSDVPDADDILSSLPPLPEEDFFPGPATGIDDFADADGEEFRPVPEDKSAKRRRTSSAMDLEADDKAPERVPLKLRGRLTEDPFARKRAAADHNVDDPGDLLGGLGLGAGPGKKEMADDLSLLLQDFSQPEESDSPDLSDLPDLPGGFGMGEEEDPEDAAGLRPGKRGRKKVADLPDLDPDLSSEFSMPDFSSLAGDSFDRGEGASLVDEVEGNLDDLLFHAKEVTAGGKKKKARKKVPEMQDDLDEADLGADLSGWGDGGIPNAGGDIDLSGMGFDEEEDDGDYQHYPDLEASFEPQPLTEAQLFARKVRRMLRRVPDTREFMHASAAWLKLLKKLPALIKQEKGLSAGLQAWLEEVRALAGMEESVFSPRSWRKTRYPEEEEEDRRQAGGQLPGYEADFDDEELLAGGPVRKKERGADFSGWGMDAPEPEEDEASAANLDGLIPAPDSWDVPGGNESAEDEGSGEFDAEERDSAASPARSLATGDTFPEDAEEEMEEPTPEDTLPEEDLSFSTADMLMQDSELGLSDLENEFDLSDTEEAETPDQIPVGETGGWQGLWRILCKVLRKWLVLCYRSLDHHVGFESNWWKLVDFLALVILTMAAAAFLSYWLWYMK